MHEQERSLSVEFVRKSAGEVKNQMAGRKQALSARPGKASQALRKETRFGDLKSIEGLSLDPESTGRIMLAESMSTRQVASKEDLALLQASHEKAISTQKGEEQASKASPATIDAYEPKESISYTEKQSQPSEKKTAQPEQPNRIPAPNKRQLEVQIGSSDFLPAWFLNTGVSRSRAVCKIETSGIDYEEIEGSWSGTGFLIAENLLMTNHHVLNSRNVCRNGLCIFNYETGEDGRVLPTKSYQLNPDRLFITSPVKELDFTICWVDGEPGKEFSTVPLYRHAFTVKTTDCANIIQHPQGRRKEVVVQRNEVQDQDEVCVYYSSDTQPGSSGSAVCNNAWRMFALHHASREMTPASLDPNDPKPAVYLNEGIKLSAIAAYLESIQPTSRDRSAADQVLSLFRGTDALMGFFGGLGRNQLNKESGLERVVDSYQGEATDVDVGFWNIEWFNKYYQDKVESVAQLIVQMNLDLWALEESSPQATEALINYLKDHYNADYDYFASEPSASTSKQTTTILWNKRTVECKPVEWPEKIKGWFSLNSNAFEDVQDLILEGKKTLEAVDGKIFDRFPGLFQVKTTNRGEGSEYDFFLVPLHLKALPEGSKRRQLASKILSVSIDTMVREYEADADWIIGGDLNATLEGGDLSLLSGGLLKPVSAKDEQEGAFTYIKRPHLSMIDHIYVSANLSTLIQEDDFFVVAKDRVLPNYTAISDHRPILVRLSLSPKPLEDNAISPGTLADQDEHQELLARLRQLQPGASRTSPGDQTRVNGDRTGGFSLILDGNKSLQQALEALEENRTRTYYDEAEDGVQRQDYYGSLPQGLSPSQLYVHFNRLLESTHRRALPYQPSVQLYPWVDLQPDGNLKSIYSGEAADPEAFIRADFEVARQREERLYALERERGFQLESARGLEATQLLEALERELPFNCEHVVPQSWFNKANPMRGDLHHLFACYPKCNSFRSNTPYFEFADWEERTMHDCGKSESAGFEPVDGKGAVARATLYFLLRYPGKIKRGNARYAPDRLPVLLAWHLQEPPSKYELHRNQAIQELQGNRNPLIDFPKLATRIDFSSGLG